MGRDSARLTARWSNIAGWVVFDEKEPGAAIYRSWGYVTWAPPSCGLTWAGDYFYFWNVKSMLSYLCRVMWLVCFPSTVSCSGYALAPPCLDGPPFPLPCAAGRDFVKRPETISSLLWNKFLNPYSKLYPHLSREPRGSHKTELLNAHACEISLLICRPDKRRQTRRGEAKVSWKKKEGIRRNWTPPLGQSARDLLVLTTPLIPVSLVICEANKGW